MDVWQACEECVQPGLAVLFRLEFGHEDFTPHQRVCGVCNAAPDVAHSVVPGVQHGANVTLHLVLVAEAQDIGADAGVVRIVRVETATGDGWELP